MLFISCSITDVRSPVCYRYFKARLDVNRSRWKQLSPNQPQGDQMNNCGMKSEAKLLN